MAGPDFPKDANGNLMRAFDAPATLLPNGHVLCVAGPVITSGGNRGWEGLPSNFFEYDGSTLTQVTGPSTAASLVTFNLRLLLLPTGQGPLFACSTDIQVYQAAGAADAGHHRKRPIGTGRRGERHPLGGPRGGSESLVVPELSDPRFAVSWAANR